MFLPWPGVITSSLRIQPWRLSAPSSRCSMVAGGARSTKSRDIDTGDQPEVAPENSGHAVTQRTGVRCAHRTSVAPGGNAPRSVRLSVLYMWSCGSPPGREPVNHMARPTPSKPAAATPPAVASHLLLGRRRPRSGSGRRPGGIGSSQTESSMLPTLSDPWATGSSLRCSGGADEMWSVCGLRHLAARRARSGGPAAAP